MVRRSGFVVRSNERWWNIVVKDTSTGDWFLLDQSLTNIEDAVGTLKDGDIEPVYEPTVEDWMRQDSEPDPADVPSGDYIGFSVADMIDWHELDGDDEYSNYYRHVKEALDRGEG